MGMPTTAIYVILVSVIAPALTKMGVAPMAAHHVHLLFRRDVVPDTAGGGVELRRRRACRCEHVADRLGRHAIVGDCAVAAVRLGLRPGAAAGRFLAIDRDRHRTTMAAILLFSRGLLALHGGNVGSVAIGIVITLAAIGLAGAPVWLGPESVTAGVIAVAA